MKWLKEWLGDQFDHTLLLNADDPSLSELQFSLTNLANIIVVPNCGAEGLAKYVFEYVDSKLKLDGAKCNVLSVTCHEDDKNSATYAP